MATGFISHDDLTPGGASKRKAPDSPINATPLDVTPLDADATPLEASPESPESPSTPATTDANNVVFRLSPPPKSSHLSAKKRRYRREVVCVATPIVAGLPLKSFMVKVTDPLITFAAIKGETLGNEVDVLFGMYGRDMIVPRKKSFYAEFVSDAFPLYRYAKEIDTPLPFTPLLQRLVDWIAAMYGQRCNHIVVNRYRNGKDHIGAHHDKPRDIAPGTMIFTLSLGATRRYRLEKDERLRNYFRGHASEEDLADFPKAHAAAEDVIEFDVHDRELFALDSLSNMVYKHSIKKVGGKAADFVGERISITLRTMRHLAIRPEGNPMGYQIVSLEEAQQRTQRRVEAFVEPELMIRVTTP